VLDQLVKNCGWSEIVANPSASISVRFHEDELGWIATWGVAMSSCETNASRRRPGFQRPE